MSRKGRPAWLPKDWEYTPRGGPHQAPWECDFCGEVGTRMLSSDYESTLICESDYCESIAKEMILS